jgi:glycosyltransferase involved in cell wall biosynthesis
MTRFIHVATSLEGGAGVAARNLHTAMLALGRDSRILTFSDSGKIPNTIYQKRGFLEKLLSKILTLVQLNLSKYSFFSLISLSSKSFIDFCSSQDLREYVLVVHNSYNLVSLSDLVKFSKNFKRVIVIQHDMRWITGGCHSPVNCNNFEIGCKACPLLPSLISGIPHLVFRRESRLIRPIADKISFVAPSEFLATATIDSTKFTKPSVSVGSNQLTSIVIEQKKLMASGEITLGVATNGRPSLLKGDDVIQEIKERLDSVKTNTKIKILEARKMADSPNRMQKFYASIDVLLVLSRMDNSPNVVHEAHSLGIPVIATEVGGITELLDHRYDWGINPQNLSADFVISGLSNFITRMQNIRNLADLISTSYIKNLNDPQLLIIDRLSNE